MIQEEKQHDELLHNISDFHKENLHHAETEERHVLPDDESRLFVSCGNPCDCVFSALLVYLPEPVYVYALQHRMTSLFHWFA